MQLCAEVLAEPSAVARLGETTWGSGSGDELLVERCELLEGVFCEAGLAVFVQGSAPASAGARDASRDVFGEALDVRGGGDGCRDEPEPTLLVEVLHPHAIGHDGVDVQEAPQVAREVLQEGDEAGLARRLPGSTPEVTFDRAGEDREDALEQVGTPREELRQRLRQREDVLSVGDFREHVVEQVGGRAGHSAACAARAHQAGLAGQAHDAIDRAGVAAEPHEAVLGVAAGGQARKNALAVSR